MGGRGGVGTEGGREGKEVKGGEKGRGGLCVEGLREEGGETGWEGNVERERRGIMKAEEDSDQRS